MSMLNLAIDLSDKIYGAEKRDSSTIQEIEDRLQAAFDRKGWAGIFEEELIIQEEVVNNK